MASVALILIALSAVLTAFAVVWHHRRQRVTAITLQLNLQRLASAQYLFKRSVVRKPPIL